MANKDKFDLEIKKLLNFDDSFFGYESARVKDLRKKDVYFSFSVWNAFYNEMKEKYPDAFEKYNEGNGGELDEKQSKYGWNPPKMCSVASSSRFIYLSLRDDINSKIKYFDETIKEKGIFHFEEKLYIPLVESQPNLDGYFDNAESSIYFEAKCHELFDSHKLVWKNGYFQDGVFFGNDAKSLGINKNECKPYSYFSKKEGKIIIDQEHMEVAPSVFGFDNDHAFTLDIKQFICHLLGIANDENSSNKRRELIYLYFKPEKLINFDEYKNLEFDFATFINSKIIKNFCIRNNIKIKLFYAVNNRMHDPLKVKLIIDSK